MVLYNEYNDRDYEEPRGWDAEMKGRRHILVTPTRCSCGGTVPEGDTVCFNCGTDHGLQQEIDTFIQKRLL